MRSFRSLVLVERASDNNNSATEVVTADPNFQFVGTMNPGNDYGKKELSPALRNRLVEIWCPALTDPDDLGLLLRTKLDSDVHKQDLIVNAILR